MDNSAIIKRINKYKAVSFDIFDTLLKRDVFRPSDVFRIVQTEAQERYEIDIDFKALRINAEKTAREKSQYPEITLDEIYEEVTIQEKEKLKALELEVESLILHCNYSFKPVYDACIDSGKDVYLVSDMYLPTSFLEEVLEREGYEGYRGIIVSADYRKTKRSGELFADFLHSYTLKCVDVIHIGDSWYADYVGPKKCRISSIHIPRVTKNTLYTPVPDDKADFETRSLFAFVNSRVRKVESRDEKLGYEVLGPILYAYCKWIHNQYEEMKTTRSRLWFAARDMYLFKEAYESIYGNSDIKGSDHIDYLYISRRSLRPILTYTTGEITESGKAFSRGDYTIAQIIEKMGYSIDDLSDKYYDKNAKYNIRVLEKYPEVKRLLSSTTILNRERELAEPGIKYLEEKGLFDSDIVLADVGWHGTTQYILRQIQKSVSDRSKLFGLYLGCLDSTNERIGKDNYKAFAFSEEKSSDFDKGILLFESLILAPHGSTRYYQKNGGVIEPVLGEPDNVSEFLENVQRGALQFVKEFKESVVGRNADLSSVNATSAFGKLALSPRK